MVWPDERWMMQLMAKGKEGGREIWGAVVLIARHIIYCTQSRDVTQIYKRKKNEGHSTDRHSSSAATDYNLELKLCSRYSVSKC